MYSERYAECDMSVGCGVAQSTRVRRLFGLEPYVECRVPRGRDTLYPRHCLLPRASYGFIIPRHATLDETRVLL